MASGMLWLQSFCEDNILVMTYHSEKIIKEFFGLCDWLLQTYEVRKYLFDDNPDECLLKEARHKSFFYRISIVFQESWMLQLVKLHDPAVQGGNANLSLQYIIEYGDWEPDFKQELVELKKAMDMLYLSIKEARNKLLSHNDYKTIIGQDVNLGEFNEGEDIKYFNALKEFCEKVSQEVLGLPFVYDTFVQNDIECFMFQFKAGVNSNCKCNSA